MFNPSREKSHVSAQPRPKCIYGYLEGGQELEVAEDSDV